MSAESALLGPLTSMEVGAGGGLSARAPQGSARVRPDLRTNTERRWFFASLVFHALVGLVCVLAVQEHEVAPLRRDFAAMNFQPLDEPSDAEASQAAAPAEPPPELPVPGPTEPDTPDLPAPEAEVLAQALPEEPPPDPDVDIPPLPTAPALTRVRPAPPPAAPAVAPAPPPAPPAPRAAASPPSGAVEQAQRYGTNRPPVYPAQARAQGITGVVLLRIEVDVTGRVGSVGVVRSSGYALLDDAARDAALEWSYVPARRGGVPVPARLDQPVRFDLSGGR